MLYCNRAIGSLIFAMLTTTSAIAAQQPKDASSFTQSQNEAVLEQLPFADRQDFEDAKRGFIGTIPDLVIEGKPGHPAIWDLAAYKFLDKEKAPDTVNPSLWRIAQLNMMNGLFKVTERVYQVRGFDMSNMTIIEGDTGLILIDPLISQETAAKALELYLQHRPKKPVVAVIYTHSHIDHYGGVKGVVKEEDVLAGKVKVIAPEGFLKEAASENVYAGTAMARRALYQYGAFLPKGERGQVDAGLGKNGSLGSSTLIAPTISIKHSGEKLSVDGVDMEFQMAPGTEAPSEFLIWFPQFKMLNTAEDVTHTLHNLYTLRGAQVRDAMSWWKAINAAIYSYGVHADVMVAQHHWPTWGSDRIVEHMANQRDMLKYIHDQTLNMANKGETMVEIAEQLKLPDSIGKKWYNRGYYGSVSHNAKAVYQRYLGWYDSNPAHLYTAAN
ncbi:MBL fold metallo-hydrolase [Pseudomonas sp. 15FMM2]|uniref:MBL fold metallo-hydrolase n=1 Tax=Pseudomonas imrae TaxID=2992837 RepID=A0ACC7P9U9_9PSED